MLPGRMPGAIAILADLVCRDLEEAVTTQMSPAAPTRISLTLLDDHAGANRSLK